MTILDLIKKTAVIFNIEKILNDSDLDGLLDIMQPVVLSNNEQLNRMFELCKVVLSEIYSHAAKEDEVVVSANNNLIDKKSLGCVGKIVSIKNQYGKADYQIKDDYIVVDNDGEYVVRYVIAPNAEFLNNEIDTLNGVITDSLLINGLSAYYCLTAGLFEEYNVYNARYVDGFSNLKNPKLFAMPCRSWHE